MKRRFFLIALLVFMGFFTVTSVSSDQNPVSFEQRGKPGFDKRPAAWTIMVYLDGDNDLEGAAVDDFLKLAAAASTPHVTIVTQFDRREGYDTRYGDWTGTKRFHVTKGSIPTGENAVMNVGEANMGDPAELVDFIRWGKTGYPASHYALLFWDRGCGKDKTKAQLWREWSQREKEGRLVVDLCRDDTSAGDSLDIAEVKKALLSGGGAHLIGFAGKLTGILAAAYQLRDCGQVLVGHGEIEPPGGWPFTAIMNDLIANPSWSAVQFGAAIVDRYYEAYGPGVTQAAVDLSKMDACEAATETVSKQFYDPADSLYGFCRSVDRPRTQGYYTETLIGHDYFGEGTAQNFQKDDDYMTVELPFDFPYFGTVIPADTDIYIGSNGYIDLDANSSHTDYSNTTSELTANKRIAPCWADLTTDGSAQQGEDIYIISNPGFLAVRWVAETYGDEEPVNFEVVLFANGFIQLNYGAGNEYIYPWDTAPTIGISKGDSSSYYLSEYNGETWLKNVSSDLFKHRSSLTVTSPNGGEEWPVGTAQGITWATIGHVGDVGIEFSTNSGETWNNIASSTDNDGFFRWIVPDDRSENCKVRVYECDVDGGPADDSDQVFTIAAGSTAAITVVSPNGGEQLVVDTVCRIEWANSGEVGNVKIDYSTTGGESWTNIVASVDNTGGCDWTVPESTSNNCRIRVSETDGSPSDISDENFSIIYPASITVTSPDGGEEWPVGSIHNITWTGSGSVGDVRIDYSSTGGETWTTIVTSTANDGSYSWTVPNTASQSCKVRVSKADSETGPWDVSDQNFTIETATALIVTHPNGGEVFEVEDTCDITWTTGGEISKVNIDYSTNGGESWTNIVQSMDNNGRYYWTVPGNTSGTCKIKVSETYGELFDISDALFAIVSTPTITVTSPNGGESWAAGSIHDITWTYTGIIGSIFIEYSTNGGNSWTTTAAATPNDGSFSWIVPYTPSQNCLVRVKGLDTDGNPVDAGNASFTITDN